jgi:hypothetical protein
MRVNTGQFLYCDIRKDSIRTKREHSNIGSRLPNTCDCITGIYEIGGSSGESPRRTRREPRSCGAARWHGPGRARAPRRNAGQITVSRPACGTACRTARRCAVAPRRDRAPARARCRGSLRPWYRVGNSLNKNALESNNQTLPNAAPNAADDTRDHDDLMSRLSGVSRTWSCGSGDRARSRRRHHRR